LPMIGFGQVYIPDANFKAYLVGEPLINTNGDSEIQQSEATAFNWEIDCPSMNIVDLTGIEEFTALISLYCDNNQITTLDVSNNTALIALNCSYNSLSSLDVSNNTDLTLLRCNNNQLTSLDVTNGNNINFAHPAQPPFDVLNNPNLYCIDVDDANYSTANWVDIDPQHYFSNNCSATSVEEQKIEKELLKVTDLLGRETKGTKNEVLFYIYDDGTVEKRIVIE